MRATNQSLEAVRQLVIVRERPSCRRCDRWRLGCATTPRKVLSGRSDQRLQRAESRCAGGCHVESWACPGLRFAMDRANLPAHGLAEMPKSPRFSPNAARVIDVLTYSAVQLLDVTGPIQVFDSANDLVAGGRSRRLDHRSR